MDEEFLRNLPRYQCVKKVHALKIKGIKGQGTPDCNCEIVPEDKRYGNVIISLEFMTKHNPRPGGYYMVYEDGYKSYLAAEDFERIYKKVI